MFTGTLNLTLEALQAIAAISHLLSWSEFRTYTLILSGIDQNTSLVRVNQDEISGASGYSLSTIKRHIETFRSLGLMRIWRGPGGSNYYRVILPLTDAVAQAVRERFPEYGMEPKRRQRKKATGETIITNGQQEESTSAVHRPAAEIIHEPVTELLPTTVKATKSALDQRISSLLDEIERGTVRNTVCRFLEAEGFLDPQLALDQKIVVNRERLLSALLEHDANTLDKFGERVQAFSQSPSGQQPYIDVPGDFPIYLLIHRKLDLDPCGEQWLRQAVKFKDDYGWPLSDWDVRKNLYDFMLGHGLRNFDEVIVMAKAKQREIVDFKKCAPYVQPEQFGLGPHYMQ